MENRGKCRKSCLGRPGDCGALRRQARASAFPPSVSCGAKLEAVPFCSMGAGERCRSPAHMRDDCVMVAKCIAASKDPQATGIHRSLINAWHLMHMLLRHVPAFRLLVIVMMTMRGFYMFLQYPLLPKSERPRWID